MTRLLSPILALGAVLLFAPPAAQAQVAPAPVPEAAPVVAPAPPRPAASPAPEPTGLTLKERLGAKWKDEQRVDNCKVPPEKRGTKPRPNDCAKAR